MATTKAKAATNRKTGKPQGRKVATKRAEGRQTVEPKQQRGNKQSGVKVTIKRAVFDNPNIPADEIEAILKKEGLTGSPMTVRAIRAEMRHSLQVLSDLGALKKKVEL